MFISSVERIAELLNDIVWLWIFMPCVIICGILLTVKTDFIQLRRLGYAIKKTFSPGVNENGGDKATLTPFQAVTTSLAATVGTGNIVGTSQAIAMGGSGAVLWMWIAALLGMAIKYSEITLSVFYREKNHLGEPVGGPMYSMKNGMRQKRLGAVYALLTAAAALGMGNMSQMNAMSGAISDGLRVLSVVGAPSEGKIRLIVGIVSAVLGGIILMGGAKRIGTVTQWLVPFMSGFYILFCLGVIICRADRLPTVLTDIVVGAFSPKAVAGGACGITLKETISWGMRRSAFSNEAGLGSGGIAHASADCSSAPEQGLFGLTEVFLDTIVICSLTAVTILVSGVEPSYGGDAGTGLMTAALSTVIGRKIATLFIAFAMAVFAFSTVIGWALYGMRGVGFVFGEKAERVYIVLFSAAAVVGSVGSTEAVWEISDVFNGLMAIPNVICLFSLSETVSRLTREQFNKDGKSSGRT